MAKKDRMKNGLDLLFEDNNTDEMTEAGNDITSLRLSMIEPDKNQPRNNFDEQKLSELAENISQHGVLQPILVRPLDNGSYKIVAGERRWRAARKAGLTEVPVIIRELTDKEAAQISLVENLQREDLDPIEEALAFKRLSDDFSMTQEEISKAVGKSRPAVANSLRLLGLPEEMQKALSEGRITQGHAKILCGVDDPLDRQALFTAALDDRTVRELQLELQNINAQKSRGETPKKIPKKKNTMEIKDEFGRFAVETRLSFRDMFGADVTLRKDKTGYKLTMNFETEDQLRQMVTELSDKYNEQV